MLKSFFKGLGGILFSKATMKVVEKAVESISDRENQNTSDKNDNWFKALERLIVEEAKIISDLAGKVEYLRNTIEKQLKLVYVLIVSNIIFLILIISILIKISK